MSILNVTILLHGSFRAVQISDAVYTIQTIQDGDGIISEAKENVLDISVYTEVKTSENTSNSKYIRHNSKQFSL